MPRQLIDRILLRAQNQIFDVSAERAEFFFDSRAEGKKIDVQNGVIKRYVFLFRISEERLQRLFADAAARNVHHAHDRFVVVRVGGKPQISENVFDFFALEEFESAENFVRNSVLCKLLLV